jgi:hypothetical protein
VGTHVRRPQQPCDTVKVDQFHLIIAEASALTNRVDGVDKVLRATDDHDDYTRLYVLQESDFVERLPMHMLVALLPPETQDILQVRWSQCMLLSEQGHLRLLRPIQARHEVQHTSGADQLENGSDCGTRF